MTLFFLPLLPLAIPYILGGLDFLRSQLFPPAPPTEPTGEPFVPPFTGGQCLTSYDVRGDFRVNVSGSIFNFNNQTIINPVEGRIVRVERTFGESGNVTSLSIIRAGVDGIEQNAGTVFPINGQTWEQVTNIRPLRRDGQNDDCGNLPNPSPAPPIASDGIPTGVAPNLDNDAVKIIDGLPLAVLPNFGAALLAALNAARQAANALDAIKSIADAIELLKDLLEKVNEDTEDKDKDGKKDVFRYEFGSIRSDGFLRLYPNAESNRYKAEQIDINLLSIPVYYGKYFGENSPNFYRFKSLGYIAFASPTFGIIEYKEIEFSRMSLKVPDDCIGFFYHLGLENDIVANVWGYYTQPQLSE